MMWNIYLLPIAFYSILSGQRVLCMTVKIVSGGTSSFSLAGSNATITANATRSYGYLGTGTRTATQARSGTTASTAITSGPSFGSGPCPTNAADYPSFIMPRINPTQSCDIYGPLCQTGSIAVGVKTDNDATTTTTVPCSCYLTAQSLTVDPTSSPWHLGFGRSQQCLDLLQIRFRPSLAVNNPIFSSCPMGHYPGAPNLGEPLNETLPRMPDGLNVAIHQDSKSCCGLCDVRILEVKILYFPESQEEAHCRKGVAPAKQSTTKPFVTPAPNPTLVHRALYPRGNASIAVNNGFTFTSPSIYMEIGQPFSMTDDCGTMGKVYPSTILPFAPGALLTVSYDVPLGADFGSHLTGSIPNGHTKTLNPHDLLCPTWGLSGNYNPEPSSDPYLAPGDADLEISVDPQDGIGVPNEVPAGAGITIGAPYYPVIVVPTEILSLDPAWARCTSILDQFIPIFDPPRTLQVDNNMAAPAGPPPTPPMPTPEVEMVPSTSKSLPSAPIAGPNPGVQTGLVQEQADPTDPNIAEAGIPATAVFPTIASPPAKTQGAAVQLNDPKAAAAEGSSSFLAPASNPPANGPATQKEPLLAAKLNAALAFSKSQAAEPIPASPSYPNNNIAIPNKPITQQATNNLSPTNDINGLSSNTVTTTTGATASPPVTPGTPNLRESVSEPPAPAFADLINDPSDNAGPPATSSEPGLGGHIYRPFIPATTAQSTVEVAPIPAGNVGAGPSMAAQVAQNPPNNDNSPQQQQQRPPRPSTDNISPESLLNTVQIPPAPPTPSAQSVNTLSNPDHGVSPPPNNAPSSNPSQVEPSLPPQQQSSPPKHDPPAITINSQTYTRNAASAYVIASQTLVPGGAEVTINNPDINTNLGSRFVSGIVSGTMSTQEIESQNATAAPTLAPSPLQISLATDGSVAILGSSTQEIIPDIPASLSVSPSSPSSSPFTLTPVSAPSSLTPPPLSSETQSAFTINSHPFILQPTPLTAAVTGADATEGEESGAVTLTGVGQTVTIASVPVELASSGSSVVLVEGSGSGGSIVAVANRTGSAVVIEPAPTGSMAASAVGVGKSSTGSMRGAREGWVWVALGLIYVMIEWMF